MAIRVIVGVSMIFATILVNVEGARPEKLNKRHGTSLTTDKGKGAAADMIQVLTTDPCKFAEDYGVEVKVNRGMLGGILGGSSGSFFFEPVQDMIVSLGKDCEKLRLEEGALQNISERIDLLKDESSQEELTCATTVGQQDSVKKVEACLNACDPQITEAQEKVDAELGQVTALANDAPELLKQESKGWFGKKGPGGSEKEWCDKATSFGSSVGNWFKGVSLGFGKKDAEKEAEEAAHKTKTAFAKQCSEWKNEQKKVEKLESQKSALQTTLESKTVELNCLTVPSTEHEDPAGCSKFNKTLPDTQEAIKSQGEAITLAAKQLVELMNQKNEEIKELGSPGTGQVETGESKPEPIGDDDMEESHDAEGEVNEDEDNSSSSLQQLQSKRIKNRLSGGKGGKGGKGLSRGGKGGNGHFYSDDYY